MKYDDDNQIKEAMEYANTIIRYVRYLSNSLSELDNAKENFISQITKVKVLSDLDSEKLEDIKHIVIGSIEQNVYENRMVINAILDFKFAIGSDEDFYGLDKVIREAREKTIEPKEEKIIKSSKKCLDARKRVFVRDWEGAANNLKNEGHSILKKFLKERKSLK